MQKWSYRWPQNCWCRSLTRLSEVLGVGRHGDRDWEDDLLWMKFCFVVFYFSVCLSLAFVEYSLLCKTVTSAWSTWGCFVFLVAAVLWWIM